MDPSTSPVSNPWTIGPDGRLRGTLPWTNGCLVCGEHNPEGFHCRLRVDGPLVWLDYTPQLHDVGYRNIVHGGVLMTLADEVMTWSAILALRGVAVAAEMTTRLQASVAAGTPVRVEASVTRASRRLVLTEGRVLDAEGRLIAVTTGKYMPVPVERAGTRHQDFVRHPDAIPPERIIDGL